MAGRKTKYTPQVIDKLVTALSVGMTDQDACVVAGITTETFYSWRRNKADFSDRTTRAREEGWQAALAVIKHSAIKDRDWRAAGEFLDRTKSAYRKSQEMQVTGPGSGPIEITEVEVTRTVPPLVEAAS